MFFVDKDQTSNPEDFPGKWDSFQVWSPNILNQMKQDLGRVWFLVEVPKSEIDTVFEMMKSILNFILGAMINLTLITITIF